jgi:hypothetical protein
MAWHNTPRIYFHAFILYAKVQIVNNTIKIKPSYKNINPVNSSKAHKIQPFGIMKLIITTHLLNITTRLKYAKPDRYRDRPAFGFRVNKQASSIYDAGRVLSIRPQAGRLR